MPLYRITYHPTEGIAPTPAHTVNVWLDSIETADGWLHEIIDGRTVAMHRADRIDTVRIIPTATPRPSTPPPWHPVAGRASAQLALITPASRVQPSDLPPTRAA